MCPKYIPTYIFYIFYWYIHVIYTRSPSSSQSLPEIHPLPPEPRVVTGTHCLDGFQRLSAPMHRKRYMTMDVYIYMYKYVSCNYIIYHLNKMCMTYEFLLVKNDVAKWFIYYEMIHLLRILKSFQFSSIYIYILYIIRTYYKHMYVKLAKPGPQIPCLSSYVLLSLRYFGFDDHTCWDTSILYLTLCWYANSPPEIIRWGVDTSQSTHQKFQGYICWRGSKGTRKTSHGNPLKIRGVHPHV